MGKIRNQDPKKIKEAADAIMDLFQKGRFTYAEIDSTLAICWALTTLELEESRPEAAGMEESMISDMAKLIRNCINHFRAEPKKNEQETSIDKPTINPN